MKPTVSLRALFVLTIAATTAQASPLDPFAGYLRPDVNTLPLHENLRDLHGITFLDGRLGNHELHRVDEFIDFDPATGVTSATITISLTAGPGGFSSILMLVDQGLLFDRVWNGLGDDVPFQQVVMQGFQYAQANIGAPIAVGTPITLSFSYAGVLVCPSAQGFASCDVGGARLDFAFAGSLFPQIYDPFSFDTTPYYERNLVLSVPAGVEAVVGADLVDQREENGKTITEWNIPVRQDLAAHVAIFGDFEERTIPGLSVPARLVYLAGQDRWADEMVEWTGSIVAFLDAQAGQPFPYPELTIVKLPAIARFPGTAGHAISLLAESYGERSAFYFEETLAHETSHVWWAVLTTDEHTNTRFLSEGLATFSQIDYSGRNEVDRDLYLGRRYNEMENVSKYGSPFNQQPPVVPLPGMPGPTEYTTWAYLKGASILDLLRVSITDDLFAAGIRRYAEDCRSVPCVTEDFEAAMSTEAGEDLSWFFDQYVYENGDPAIQIDFDDNQITLRQSDSTINVLELWLERPEGTEKVRVRVDSPTTTVPLTSPVLRVRPNPRYETMVRLSTPNDLDIDFDAQLDGADLIRCAHQLGKMAFGQIGTGDGVTGVSTEFESRCDFDADGRITRDDLGAMTARYPEVR